MWRPLLHHLRGSARLRAVAEQAGRHQSEGIVVIALFQILHFNHYISTNNHMSGHGQAGEGHSVPQHHDLHRGYQHGRYHGGCHKRFQ